MSRAIERIREALREKPVPTMEEEMVEPMSASSEGVADAVLTMARELSEPRKAIVFLLRSWKASTTHPAPATVTVTDEQMADAMMAFNGWDRDDGVNPATRAALRAQWLGDSWGKRDSMYAAVKRAVLAARGGAR